MTRYMSLAGLLGAALLSACDYEKNAVQDITGPAGSARVKFFNFSVGSPGVNFYANDTKMTAITSATGAESTVGVAFTGVGAGGFYSAIEPGQYNLSGRISATTDKDKPISSLTANIESGKHYSYYLSGIYNTTAKTTDAFIVEDPIPTIDYSVAHVRFVNAVHNSQPMVLSVTNTTTSTATPIGAAVGYKSAGGFVGVPGGAYTLAARVPGTATDVVTRTGISFVAGRVYTITVRGDIGNATAANRPFLDNTLNR